MMRNTVLDSQPIQLADLNRKLQAFCGRSYCAQTSPEAFISVQPGALFALDFIFSHLVSYSVGSV